MVFQQVINKFYRIVTGTWKNSNTNNPLMQMRCRHQ